MIPATVAIRNPAPKRMRLGITSSANRWAVHVSRKTCTIRCNGGRKGLVLLTDRNHQAANSATGVRISTASRPALLFTGRAPVRWDACHLRVTRSSRVNPHAIRMPRSPLETTSAYMRGSCIAYWDLITL